MGEALMGDVGIAAGAGAREVAAGTEGSTADDAGGELTGAGGADPEAPGDEGATAAGAGEGDAGAA